MNNGFSIVMPSYLGRYKLAARNREKKIFRAIDSVLAQTYPNWELIIVADGCQRTVELVKRYTDKRIKGYLVPKQMIWDGTPRNTGIYKATKQWIIYLDIDDMYVSDYLENINKQITTHDWYYCDDIWWDRNKKDWFRNNCTLELTRCGTSNIIHKQNLGVYWSRGSTYLHDWVFINRLMEYKNNAKLDVAGYKVMHAPLMYDL